MLLILIGLRPTLPGNDSASAGNNNLDVLFVVDTTLSMLAEDYNSGDIRLNGVKSDIAAITRQLAGARFGLITFDNTAVLSVPFTTDTTAVVSAAEVLYPINSKYAAGTSLDVPIELAKNTLESAATKIGRVQVVFLMSDGEQTAQQDPSSFSELEVLVGAGSVLGYGTAGGGRIVKLDSFNKPAGYMQWDAISKIDENNLRKIADDIGINYHHRQESDDASSLVSDIRPRIAQAASERSVDVRQEIYWVFATIFICLLLWELWTLLGELLPKKGRLK